MFFLKIMKILKTKNCKIAILRFLKCRYYGEKYGIPPMGGYINWGLAHPLRNHQRKENNNGTTRNAVLSCFR